MKLKKVKVIFVADEHIEKVSSCPRNGITSLQSRGLQNALKSNIRFTKIEAILCHSLAPLKEEETALDCEVIFKPTAIVENECDNSEVFGFRTPTKKFSKNAGNSSSKFKKFENSPKTPKSLRKTARRSITTPKRNEKTIPTTPYSLRKKIKKRLSRFTDIDKSDEDSYDDSDVDGHYAPSDASTDDSETEDVDINDNNTPMKMLRGLMKQGLRTPLRTPRRGRIHKVDTDMVANSEDYFTHNSDPSTCITSDHTLNRLENPRLGPEILKSILEGVHKSHEVEKQEIIDDHVSLFPHWMTLLFENFSIFLCGVGSKKNLLSLFQLQMLSDIDHVVLNGFFPSITLKSIMVTILEDIMGLKCFPQGHNDQLQVIRVHYDKASSSPLVLVINNLDGPMLRPEKTQFVLSQMASFKNIHVVASVDHINAPLIFDAFKSSCYNPLWFDATTLASYSEETSYENSLMIQQSGALALSSLIHVFKSLTPNAKGIFLLLARFQIEKKDDASYAGMSLNDLYYKCRENFLVNSELTLRAQLTEFRDHKLIKAKKSSDAVECLIIPLNCSILQEFLDDHMD